MKEAGVAGQQGKMVSAVLRHPIRVRVLEMLSIRDEISATTFVNRGMGRDIQELRGRTPQQQVSDVSYHLRELEKANAVCLTREVKRRGTKEKFFRARAVAYFSDAEWAGLDRAARREISRVVAQGLLVQIEGAMLADTFDTRTSRWLLWEPKRLDERGWSEMTTAIAAFHAEAKLIERDSEQRLREDGEDAAPIHSTFGVVLFESPEPPVLPDEADAPDGR
jgi:hypothetical protein